MGTEAGSVATEMTTITKEKMGDSGDDGLYGDCECYGKDCPCKCKS